MVDDGYFCKVRDDLSSADESLPDNIQREVDRIRKEYLDNPVAAAEHVVRITQANPSLAKAILTALTP